MTQPTNTHDQYDLVGQREDLSDMIYNISPTETPFMTYAARGRASNIFTEWQTDALAAASTSNAHIDGDDATGQVLSPTVRIGNYNQISRKTPIVSGRADIVDKAGRRRELAYQIAKLAKELKRDMEAILTNNQASLAGNSTTAGTLGGLPAWLTTNVDRGATGTSGGFSGGIVAAAGDGTLRALSEATLRTNIKDIYVQGGMPTCVMVSPGVKEKFSAYMFGTSARIATPYQDHGAKNMEPGNAIGAIDYYVSDFGVLEVVPNRFQRVRDVFVLDKDYWEVGYLRSFRTERLAKTGDSEKRLLLVDYTLCSKNEAASGVIADIDETLAMVA